jgi:hypothetical protein
MDEAAGWLIAVVLGFIVFAFVITGVIWLVINFWWVFLLVGVVATAWLVYRHPGVRAKRELKVAVKRGDQLRGDIRTATERAKAEMDEIVRDWNTP